MLSAQFADAKKARRRRFSSAVIRRRRGAAGSADDAIILKFKNDFENQESRSTETGRGRIAAGGSGAVGDGGTEAVIVFAIALAICGRQVVAVPKTAS